MGPIFVLVFNRGAVYGFWKGFTTAFGAAIGDSLLFTLGLVGVLSLLEQARQFMLVMDIVGGVVLMLLGFKTLFYSEPKQISSDAVRISEAPGILCVMKSLTLTVVNPLTIMFFMFISIRMLPDGVVALSVSQALFSGGMVFLGSLTMLSLVSLGASVFGGVMNTRTLRLVSYFTGILFIAIGVYFLSDFILKLSCRF
jgi:threonine/homoserine/homoserine lactone efflux protein